MFWSILLKWMLAGAVTEAITYVILGLYSFVRAGIDGFLEEAGCERALKNMAKDAIVKHAGWSGFLYKILPRPVSDIVDVCWTIIVWPLEIPLLIVHFKRANDEFLDKHKVNKASD